MKEEAVKSGILAEIGFELAHVGINCADGEAASEVAAKFNSAFGFSAKPGSSSIFSSPGIEIMKSKYLGANGHIAIRTNDILRAADYLVSRGFTLNEAAKKYDDQGNLAAVYLTEEFGGFAVHLVQKK